MEDYERIRAAGWRQGVVASAELITSLASNSTRPTPVSPEDVAVLITQDCDVVCVDFDLEPTVEFLIARQLPPEQRDGNFEHGKNPRRLQFDLSGRLFEIRSGERWFVDRIQLASREPDQSVILPENVALLLPEWVAKKYTRAALPDELVERLRGAMRPMRNALKNDGQFVSALFLAVDPMEELQAGSSYEIELTILAPDEAVSDERSGVRLKELETTVDKILTKVKGVVVRDVRLRSESAYTYAELIRSIEWDVYDDLSYRE